MVDTEGEPAGQRRLRPTRSVMCLGTILAAVALAGCNSQLPTHGQVHASTFNRLQDNDGRELYDEGRAYEQGDGVPRDPARAAALYEAAVRHGYAPASERLGLMAARGEIAVDEATMRDRLNAAYLRDGASGGVELARQILASQSSSSQDIDRAVGILSDLSDGDEPAAELELARIYSDPAYGRTDYPAAERLYQDLYAAGEQRAAYELARIYADETVPIHNPARAQQWAMVAAAVGEPRGWLVMGEGLADPQSASYDPAAAENAFRGAINAGVPGARRDLALFLTGQGRNAEAWALYQELLASGEDPAVAYDAARLIDDGGFSDRANAYPLYLAALGSADEPSAIRRMLGMLEDNVGLPGVQATALGSVASYADRSGDAQLIGRVGYLYLQGRGGPPDADRAIGYLQRAADAGNTQAAARAARLFRDGAPGIPADPAAAARLFNIAAASGDVDALTNVGRMQEAGGSLAEAAQSYLQAANAGSSQAAGRLYRLVRDNPGLAVDMEPLIAALQSAAEAGDVDAMVALGDVASEPAGGSRYDEAIAWYQRAADAGNPTALRRLGDLAADGVGGLSPSQALDYYEQAAALGDTAVGARIARSILQGTPDQSQVAQALELTAGPAQAGDPNGQYWHGVAQRFAGNYEESLDWLIRAYQGGEVDAISQMATTATEGAAQGLDVEGRFAELASQGGDCERAPWYTMLGDLAARGAVPVDKADDYYLEAMRLGDAHAAAAMGRLHVTGVGLAQPDLAAANVYLTMAQEAGVPGVDGNLANLDLLMSDDERARTSEIAPQLRGQMETVCP